jgi:hypothetical protein
MSRRPRPPESPAARRIREAEDALDLALEFRDPELAGGADILARRLEEAARIRREGTAIGKVVRVGTDSFTFVGCPRGGVAKACVCDGACWRKEDRG